MRCSYYGYRDDDDGELIPAEAAAEAAGIASLRLLFVDVNVAGPLDSVHSRRFFVCAAIAAAQAEWDRVREEKIRGGGVGGKQDDDEDNGKFVSFVPLPTQAEIESAILAKRKAELLQVRYAAAPTHSLAAYT